MKNQVPMVTKTLRVLEAFRVRGTGLSLGEVVELCQIPKASTFRILETLRTNGYLTKAGPGRYRLTHRLLELGATVQKVNPWRRRALSHLQNLQQKCGETVNLGVLEDDRVVYTEILPSERSVPVQPVVGSPAPVNATALGKAILAWLPEENQIQIIERQSLLGFTPKTIVTKKALLAEFRKIRSIGYALDAEEETPGYICVAAPIFGRMGYSISAISVSAPSSRMPPAIVNQLVSSVIETCQDVQRAWGFAGEGPPAASSNC